MVRYSCAKIPIICSLCIRMSTQGYAIVSGWLIVLAFWRSSILIECKTFVPLFLSAPRILLEILRIVRRKFYSIWLLRSPIFSANVWKYAKYNFRDFSPVHPRIAIHLLSCCRFPMCAGFYLLYVCEVVGLPATPESTGKKSLLHLRIRNVYRRCFDQITRLVLSNWWVVAVQIEFAC